MNVYRNVPGLKPSSKATPTTLCQKCLKKDIYECKASNQERPYKSRPSRTQQLQNPKLVPQLTSDVHHDISRTKGVADEELAKREKERERKREMEDEDDTSGGQGYAAKRARSASTFSSSSVSTISTNRSPSQSPKRRRYDTRDSMSPPPRARNTLPTAPGSSGRKRRYSDSSSDYSYSSRSSIGRRQSDSREPDRNTRRRRTERSPDERGRSYNWDRRGSWRGRTGSASMDKSRIARERRSLTPAVDTQGGNYPIDRHSSPAERRRLPRDEDRSRGRHAERREADDRTRHQAPPPPPQKERSLSPFSKRLALTQAMNLGR